ncbi:glycosyl transferase family 1 [Neoroseomonas rubea]|uniref:glycosyl transferase family 1 n=1 Tax=Neoroseomonas rubea TaxID=2748666 RepID=UPI0018DF412C|nr:glycosyl transferase family 1 [Roseomonas rubea]
MLRRLDMLRPYLTAAVVIGYHRTGAAPAEVGGWPAISLGRTVDSKLGHRAWSVLRARLLLRRLQLHMVGATVVIARQLEMLVLARSAREQHAPDAVLAYECLDIHRLMVVRSPIGFALRWLERRLLLATDLLIVSSTAFVREHLAVVHGQRLPPICLVENKVLRSDLTSLPTRSLKPTGPPWRIGLFGVLRCRRSLDLLAALVRQLPGKVVVDLRGRPSYAAIPDFDSIVATTPGLRFLGAYDRRKDLAAIYGAVHFVWSIDFFEADGNSRWLLPNRLYEGGYHGVVPIALAAVETGRWLATQGAGMLLAEPLAVDLLRHFSELRPDAYAEAAAQVARVERSAWLDEGQDGERLAAALCIRRPKQHAAASTAPVTHRSR